MPEEPMIQAFAIPMNKAIMEQVQGIAKKRHDLIDKLMEDNISEWKLWIMKKWVKMGKIFGYGISVEPVAPKEGEMVREKITLKCKEEILEGIEFSVKIDEGLDLYSMLSKTAYPDRSNQERPGYIG